MQKHLVAMILVGAMAAGAGGAEVHFFMTSPLDGQCATPQLAMANGTNPVVPTGNIIFDIWMALDSALNAGVTGATIDIAAQGSQTGGGILPYDNSGGAWDSTLSTNGAVGGAGYVFQGLVVVTRNPSGVQPATIAPNFVIGNQSVYHIASGAFNSAGPGALFFEIPNFGSIGTNDPTDSIAGAAFGWDATNQPDVVAYYGPGYSVQVPYKNNNAALGFYADGAINGPIRENRGSTVLSRPDLIVVPEPATLTILIAAMTAVGRLPRRAMRRR